MFRLSLPFLVRPLTLIAALAVLLALSGAGGAKADSGARNYLYILGAEPLCEEEHACPDVAMADNGDWIEIAGEGTLSIHPNSVTGGGEFTHHFAGGSVSGTWAAKQLLGFHSFGSGSAQGAPPEFEGGRVLMRVTLSVGGTPVHDAILQFDCLLGHPPAGAQEGVRLAVQDALNFNEKVSGDTVLIRQ